METTHNDVAASERPRVVDLPDASDRLITLDSYQADLVATIREWLRKDAVVLCPQVSETVAGDTVRGVAEALGLGEQLTLQAGFAAFLGHRHRVGDYFMSVNRRGDFQFIPPHSEGTGFQSIQLASFYCFENSTDGGETILMNVRRSGDAWD